MNSKNWSSWLRGGSLNHIQFTGSVNRNETLVKAGSTPGCTRRSQTRDVGIPNVEHRLFTIISTDGVETLNTTISLSDCGRTSLQFTPMSKLCEQLDQIFSGRE